MPQQDRLLTLQETAELLGYSVTHVMRLIGSGVLKSAKTGPRVMVVVPEMTELLEEEAS